MICYRGDSANTDGDGAATTGRDGPSDPAVQFVTPHFDPATIAIIHRAADGHARSGGGNGISTDAHVDAVRY